MMAKDNYSDYIERAPLFPGSSCFPLSPDINSNLTSTGYPCNPGD